MTLPKVEGLNVGQHPLACQVMKGIFQKKPPLPRYSAIWDVPKVLIFIRSLGDNESLSLKHLSEKLVVLLALTSADQGSELAAHDLRFRKFHPEGAEFNLSELTKSVHVGKNLKSSFHSSFPQDKLLCPCECLKVYESLTSTFRPVDPAQPNKLFLAIIRPHKPVKSATLVHWIKNLLVKSGIDSNIFTAHSTRGAASSTAARAGMSVSDILRVADWSSDNTFQRFYYKPVHDPSFGRTVLSLT